MAETLREKLNRIDLKCLDEDLKYHDLRNLFEATAPKLSPQDKEEVKKVIQNTDDAEVIAAVLQAKALDKKESLQEDQDKGQYEVFIYGQNRHVRKPFEYFDSEIEAEDFCNEHNWEYTDPESRFVWKMDYRKVPTGETDKDIYGFELTEDISSDEIFDYLDELGGYLDYDDKIEALMDDFSLSKDEAEGFVWDWSSGLHELEKESELEEKLVDAPQEVVDELLEILEKYGFVLDNSFKVNPGKTWMGETHIQVINPDSYIDDSDEINIQDQLVQYVTKDLIDDIHELDERSNCPITWNFGPNKDGQVTGGLDIMKQYVEENLNEGYEWKIIYGKGRPEGMEEIVEFPTYKDVFRYAADNAHGWGFEIKNISLDEASYGGAYDIEDDMYFTKEELMEFGYDLAEQFSAWAEGTCELSDLYMTSPTDLVIEVSDEDGAEHKAKIKIDMRKIKLPKDIYKYSDIILKQWKDSYNEYHDYDEELDEAKKVSFDIIVDDEHFTLDDEEADWALEDISAVHVKPSDVAVYESNADADYFILTFKDGTKKAWYIHSGMYIPDDDFNESLDDEKEYTNFVKKNINSNKNFDYKKYGKYFDKEGKLIPELEDEYMSIIKTSDLNEDFISDKVEIVKGNLNKPEGYKAFYELEKYITDNKLDTSILYDLAADFDWDDRLNDEVNKLAKMDGRDDLINESLQEAARLNNRDKQIYINALKEAEDREDLEDIVHEIFFYDKGLFVMLRHFPKDMPFEELRDKLIEIIQSTILEEAVEDQIKIPKPFNKYFEIDNSGLDPNYDIMPGDEIEDYGCHLIGYLYPKKKYENKIDMSPILTDDPDYPVVELAGGRLYPVDSIDIYDKVNDFQQVYSENLNESSELTDEDWQDFFKLEEEIANVMHGIDSDLDDAQANMYHDDYDGTTRLTFRFVCGVDKISDKTRKTIINALEKYLNSTKFNQFIYIQLYPIKVPVGASYEVIINAETEPEEIKEALKESLWNNYLIEFKDIDDDRNYSEEYEADSRKEAIELFRYDYPESDGYKILHVYKLSDEGWEETYYNYDESLRENIDERINLLRNKLLDLNKAIENGEDPEKVSWEKEKIFNELDKLGVNYYDESLEEGITAKQQRSPKKYVYEICDRLGWNPPTFIDAVAGGYRLRYREDSKEEAQETIDAVQRVASEMGIKVKRPVVKPTNQLAPNDDWTDYEGPTKEDSFGRTTPDWDSEEYKTWKEANYHPTYYSYIVIPRYEEEDESLEEDYQHNDDEWGDPYTFDEVERELKKITNDWTDEGTIRCYWEQEKEYGLQLLKDHYKHVDVSDGRTGPGEDMSWVLAYAKPKAPLNEGWTRDDYLRLEHDGYVDIDRVEDYIWAKYDGDIDDKKACARSLMNTEIYQDEGKVGTDVINEFAGAHDLIYRQDFDEMLNESKSSYLKDKIIDCLDWFILMEMDFPKDKFLADSWEDVKDGIQMGIDPQFEVAEGIIEYLKPIITFNKKYNKEVGEEGVFQDEIEMYQSLVRAMNNYLAKNGYEDRIEEDFSFEDNADQMKDLMGQNSNLFNKMIDDVETPKKDTRIFKFLKRKEK